MKSFYSLLFAITLSTGLYAQAPDGKLFIHSVQDTLYSVQYPSEQIQVVDVTRGQDLMWHDSLLFVADTNIRYYSANSEMMLGSIVGANAQNLAVWNDQLLVGSNMPPHFKVYDMSNNFALLYSLDLDTTVISSMDLDVSGSTAFWMAYNTVYPIDLAAQDTLSRITPNSSNLFRQFENGTVAADGRYYVQMPYITALPRVDLMRIDNQTLTLDSLYHKEFEVHIVEPVQTGDQFRVWSYGAFWDIPADTVVDQGNDTSTVLAYDTQSEAIFLANVASFSDQRFWFEINGISSNPLPLPTPIRRTVWRPTPPPLSIIDFTPLPEVFMFPNPTSGQLTIDVGVEQPESIQLMDITGRVMYVNHMATQGNRQIWDIAPLTPGVYIVRVHFHQHTKTLRLVKQ